MSLFSREFWVETAERALKSAAQYGIGAWGLAAFTAVGDVLPVAQATALAMGWGLVASTLTSVASIAVGPKGSASLVGEVPPKHEE